MTDTASQPRPSRRLAWSTGLLALVMSLFTVLQVHHYGETRPTIADPGRGRTHAVKIHQRVVYLTGGELSAAMVSHVMAIGSIGVFLGVLLKSWRSKT